MTKDYFEKETPDDYMLLNETTSAVLTDGKDYLCETIWTENSKHRRLHSSKMETDALCCCTWSTGSGLTFEQTRGFGARASENDLIKLHRELGRMKALLDEWCNFGKDNSPSNPMQKTYLSALDLLEKIPEEGEKNDGDDNLPDDTLKSYEDVTDNSLISIFNWSEKRLTIRRVDEKLKMSQPNVDTKMFTKRCTSSTDDLKKINALLVTNSPQSTPSEFFDQLEFLEKLHHEYNCHNSPYKKYA